MLTLIFTISTITRRFVMLVLSKRKGEVIVINNEVTVSVVEIRGDQVRLGFIAPKEVQINRREVHEKIHAAKAKDEATTNGL